MSLLDSAMESCTMIDKTSVPDGLGGTKKVYVDGAPFDCATTLNTSTEARLAEKQGVKSLYTATTRKNVNLQFHDVFRRNRDGKIFRVTSDGDDNKTPDSAILDMRVVTCEEWEIPSNE